MRRRKCRDLTDIVGRRHLDKIEPGRFRRLKRFFELDDAEHVTVVINETDARCVNLTIGAGPLFLGYGTQIRTSCDLPNLLCCHPEIANVCRSNHMPRM